MIMTMTPPSFDHGIPTILSNDNEDHAPDRRDDNSNDHSAQSLDVPSELNNSPPVVDLEVSNPTEHVDVFSSTPLTRVDTLVKKRWSET